MLLLTHGAAAVAIAGAAVDVAAVAAVAAVAGADVRAGSGVVGFASFGFAKADAYATLQQR